MTLTDPRGALADQSDFIGYLVGLAGHAQVVHTLADGDRRVKGPSDADDFVHVLLGFASIGAAIEHLANSAMAQHNQAAEAPPSATPTTRWLR
jgi:F0F1-type ATP synthase epsilon subunit